ncbi:hypothetical protein KIL84_012418 [Mauremys mutica]|uniref:Uncharacterized protein n=1 Tax=Mauremys mutica TaxID=74926 RepID=A0A9D3XZB1_9SAUR|nr:hypothetical protein KIL84_012418 [Mauremys mutica]
MAFVLPAGEIGCHDKPGLGPAKATAPCRIHQHPPVPGLARSRRKLTFCEPAGEPPPQHPPPPKLGDRATSLERLVSFIGPTAGARDTFLNFCRAHVLPLGVGPVKETCPVHATLPPPKKCPFPEGETRKRPFWKAGFFAPI